MPDGGAKLIIFKYILYPRKKINQGDERNTTFSLKDLLSQNR